MHKNWAAIAAIVEPARRVRIAVERDEGKLIAMQTADPSLFTQERNPIPLSLLREVVADDRDPDFTEWLVEAVMVRITSPQKGSLVPHASGVVTQKSYHLAWSESPPVFVDLMGRGYLVWFYAEYRNECDIELLDLVPPEVIDLTS